MDEIKLNIDGIIVNAHRGMTVLEAATAAGIYIPTLCYHEDLLPHGSCRLCIVEIEKMRGFPTACTTPVSDGMVVHTDTAAVNNIRRTAVQLLIADHPDNCLTCPQNQNCELQKVAAYLGVERAPFRKTKRIFEADTSNPFFNFNRNQCILCARCVRTCDEVTGVGAIELINRGYDTKVATFGDAGLLDSICRSCGECVSHCPTGALTAKKTSLPAKETLTTCPYCGVGCQIYLGVRGDKITGVRAKKDNTPNSGWLCVKGRYGIKEFVHNEDRLTTPLIKKNGKFYKASWEEALSLVTEKFAQYSGDELAVITSAKCTNEDNYVAQKFARAVLQTNNVDHCARLCHASTVAGLGQSFGAGAMTNSINEIKNSACILAIGTNTTEAHPVIGFEMKQAVRRGAILIVANPREIELVQYAHLFLQHRPGTDVALLMGMMKVIVDEDLLDKDFITKRCENFEVFRDSLKNFGTDLVTKITGVPQDKIKKAARLYAKHSPASIYYAMGITQHSHGTDNVIATANLAMLTGNVGKEGAGVNPLRGQNNVQGACDLGALPNVYTGYQKVSEEGMRQKFEEDWNCNLPRKPGLAVTEVIPQAAAGKIKAIYLIGENPVISEPDAAHTREALSKLEFMVSQDIFLTETAQLADVVLPGACFAEKNGTFTSTERRVQRVRKAVPLPGEAVPDWRITCLIARKMGAHGFSYTHPSQIMNEIAALTPSYGGISYKRLESSGGLQWPCLTPDHAGTRFLHSGKFARGLGRFISLEYLPSKELPDDEYSLLLTTGRNINHFHTGTMTRKVKGLNTLYGKGVIEINSKDAERLNLGDDETVKVTSRRGTINAITKITEISPPGVVFMTFHFAESPVNVLTNPVLDPVAKIPELKVCAVKIEKIN